MVGRWRPRLDARIMNIRLEMRALGISESREKAATKVSTTVRDLVNTAENCLNLSTITSGTTKLKS